MLLPFASRRAVHAIGLDAAAKAARSSVYVIDPYVAAIGC